MIESEFEKVKKKLNMIGSGFEKVKKKKCDSLD